MSPERTPAIIISGAVEGVVDETLVRRLIEEAGGVAGRIVVAGGKTSLRSRIHGYNNAARFAPWAVLVDLDRETECAPSCREIWLPEPAPLMRFRIIVRAAEAWLLADRKGIADFLEAPLSLVPVQPEDEPDPKRTLVNLASRSRRKEIRLDMSSDPRSGRLVGPAYSVRLSEFISHHWRPDVAALSSDSLRRCRLRLRELAG